MIERLGFALALLAFGMIAYRWMIARQMRHATALASGDPLLRGIKSGVPTIVYFTTPTCVPCKTQQAPALNRLREELGDSVQVVQVDATEHPDDATRWGVLSVPTTFVIDGSGTTLAVNHGVAPTEKLRQQLQTA